MSEHAKYVQDWRDEANDDGWRSDIVLSNLGKVVAAIAADVDRHTEILVKLSDKTDSRIDSLIERVAKLEAHAWENDPTDEPPNPSQCLRRRLNQANSSVAKNWRDSWQSAGPGEGVEPAPFTRDGIAWSDDEPPNPSPGLIETAKPAPRTFTPEQAFAFDPPQGRPGHHRCRTCHRRNWTMVRPMDDCDIVRAEFSGANTDRSGEYVRKERLDKVTADLDLAHQTITVSIADLDAANQRIEDLEGDNAQLTKSLAGQALVINDLQSKLDASITAEDKAQERIKELEAELAQAKEAMHAGCDYHMGNLEAINNGLRQHIKKLEIVNESLTDHLNKYCQKHDDKPVLGPDSKEPPEVRR